MDTIELRTTHVKDDKNATFKEVYIGGSSFQKSLKHKYPLEFSKGRYREEFIPRLNATVTDRSHSADVKSHAVIAPIYGCMDGCCVYLFAEIEYTKTQVKWVRIAQDSCYFGIERSEQEPLVWLNGFENLVFDRGDYEDIFN